MSGTGADLDMLATDLIDTSAGYYTYPVSCFEIFSLQFWVHGCYRPFGHLCRLLHLPGFGFRV
jgi:hypothetical protein